MAIVFVHEEIYGLRILVDLINLFSERFGFPGRVRNFRYFFNQRADVTFA